MVTLVNRAKMSTSTTGTGTITLGSAETGYQSFADAGVADGDVVRYVIEDGDDWEIGSGTYTASGTTLSRTVDESSNSDAALNLTGSAVVFITAAAEDVFQGELFAENYNGTSTKPTASGTNGIAIGDSASNTAGRGIALGSFSKVSNDYAVAIGRSFAGGGYSAAMVIGTNSASYGATGTNSVAIGQNAKATATNSVAIGDTATSTTANQIALGGTTDTVKISGAYTLPTSDGTNGQVLTTDGSGAVTFADAGGGSSLELFVENPSSPTAPSATGTNAVAIGSNTTASGNDGIAIGTSVTASVGLRPIVLGYSSSATQTSALALGTNSQATNFGSVAIGGYGTTSSLESRSSGTYSIAIGASSDSTATGSLALGYNSQSIADNAIALGNSRAGAASSIAGSINNNISSYGTTSVNSVAFGTQSKATNNSAVSIGQSSIASGYQSAAYGYNAVASGQDSFAGGPTTDATATNSTALGKNAQATHANATAVGYNAATSATNQVALGASGYAVQISGAYTLPTSDGTNGQVLTTDGSGAVTFADAGGGGGFTSIVENYTNGTAPTVTGNDSVGIGDSTTASGPDSYAIGYIATAAGAQAIALGFLANVGSGSTLGAAALGYKATVGAGASSVALGTSYVSGTDSLAAAITNNTSSYGATGSNSVALGQLAKANQTNAFGVGYLAQATGQRATAIGYNTTASGTSDVAIGQSNTASGSYSVAIGRSSSATSLNAVALGNYHTASGNGSGAIGYNNAASATNSYAIGREAKASIIGQVAFSNGSMNTQGDTQSSIFILKRDTTNATATTLTTDNSGPTSSNTLVLTNESAISFTGTVVCREDATNGDDYAGWEVKGVIMRQGAAADTTLGVGIVNKLYSTSGISAADVALSADTTNGGLKVEVTGVASTNLRWVATINTSEVINA